MGSPCAALLDIDGTLVDSNYFHAIAWYRAFRRSGRAIPVAAIHRLVGMGADQFLERLIGSYDSDVEARWKEEFSGLREAIAATPGAAELVRTLKRRGAITVYATSGQPDDVDALRAVIGADESVDATVNSSEVDASKPAPDIFRLALDRAGVRPEDAVVIGDTVWDVEAAHACGIGCVAVTTGGVAECELRRAGALAVYESPQQLLDELDASPVGALLERRTEDSRAAGR